MIEQVKSEGEGGSVELAMQGLLNSRLETIPWHVSNVGPEFAELRSWEHRSLLQMLNPSANKEVLCAYDTLGILTHLCITLGMSATYHSTKDLYSFAEVPVRKFACDPLNMPPKHEFFYHYKYDAIVSTYLFNPAKSRPGGAFSLMGTLRPLLKPRGFFVLSYCDVDSDSVVEAIDAVGMVVDGIDVRQGARGVCGVIRARNADASE
jgi:hypothetical protein